MYNPTQDKDLDQRVNIQNIFFANREIKLTLSPVMKYSNNDAAQLMSRYHPLSSLSLHYH